MTTSTRRPVSLRRVPVSTTESRMAKRETGVPVLVGANPTHMARLVGVLVHTYGWVLGQDGNLYAPDASMAWGERVA
jgi:hypothetical protein